MANLAISFADAKRNAAWSTAAIFAVAVLLSYVGRVKIPAGGTSGTATRVERPKLYAVLIGEDNRLSTSKTIAAGWTAVVAYVLLTLMWTWPKDWNKALSNLSPTYLLLLGGPYAALVMAKVAVSNRIDDHTLSKPPADAARLSDLVNNDHGQPDLFDFQYVIFNAVAIIFALRAFGKSGGDGFPDIPTGMLLLTGGPAAVYVSNKYLGKDSPQLTVTPPVTPSRSTPRVGSRTRNRAHPNQPFRCESVARDSTLWSSAQARSSSLG